MFKDLCAHEHSVTVARYSKRMKTWRSGAPETNQKRITRGGSGGGQPGQREAAHRGPQGEVVLTLTLTLTLTMTLTLTLTLTPTLTLGGPPRPGRRGCRRRAPSRAPR